jgi:mannose-6-phosphate isomerase-like protein (cupin superfamily)
MTFALIFLATGARAQQAPPAAQPTKMFSSAADVMGLIAKAKSERKEGQANVSERILQLAPYSANLEYRASIGTAAIHEHDAEFFYVIDGGGTLVTGGKLVDEKRTSPVNLSGTAIEGGTSQHIAKGDFVVVPEGTAHWFSALDGTIVLMTLHVPRPVPAAN